MEDEFGIGQSSGLPTKECIEWTVTTALLNLDQVPKIMLRMNLKATESCPENIVSYEVKTIPFSVSLLNLIVPDLSVPTFNEESRLS